MRIAVLGASGNFGSAASDKLEGDGHQVVRISRSLGVDVLTGQGLRSALDGVDVVVDALNHMKLSARKSMDYFTRVATNTVDAARAQNVQRIVCLSIAGAANPRVNQGYGYYKGKAAQENVYQAADIPSTTLRSTQWFELVEQIMGMTTKGPVSVLPRMLMAPAAMESVAALAAQVVTTEGEARNEIVAVRGPEVDTAANFARRILAVTGDIGGLRPKIIKEVPFFGRAIATGGLIPDDAHVDPVTLEEWLAR